jgi:hypothetical protein
MKGRAPAEAGIALLHVVILMTMVMAVAGGAAVLARMEVLVSRYHRDEREAAYAAQAILAVAIQDLDRAPSWSDVLAGGRQATFADGPASAPRQIPGGGTIVVCCGPGTLTDRVQAESGLPWRPFAWHSLAGLLALPRAAPYYLIAWVVDDPGDDDGDAAADSNGRIIVRAEAVTPLGVRRGVEATLQRAPPDPADGTVAPGLQMLTWRVIP